MGNLSINTRINRKNKSKIKKTNKKLLTKHYNSRKYFRVTPTSTILSKILVIKAIIKREIPSEIALTLIVSACLLIYHYLWITINETMRTPEKSQITTKRRKEKITMTIVIRVRAVRAGIFLS